MTQEFLTSGTAQFKNTINLIFNYDEGMIEGGTMRVYGFNNPEMDDFPMLEISFPINTKIAHQSVYGIFTHTIYTTLSNTNIWWFGFMEPDGSSNNIREVKMRAIPLNQSKTNPIRLNAQNQTTNIYFQLREKIIGFPAFTFPKVTGADRYVVFLSYQGEPILRKRLRRNFFCEYDLLYNSPNLFIFDPPTAFYKFVIGKGLRIFNTTTGGIHSWDIIINTPNNNARRLPVSENITNELSVTNSIPLGRYSEFRLIGEVEVNYPTQVTERLYNAQISLPGNLPLTNVSNNNFTGFRANMWSSSSISSKSSSSSSSRSSRSSSKSSTSSFVSSSSRSSRSSSSSTSFLEALSICPTISVNYNINLQNLTTAGPFYRTNLFRWESTNYSVYLVKEPTPLFSPIYGQVTWTVRDLAYNDIGLFTTIVTDDPTTITSGNWRRWRKDGEATNVVFKDGLSC
jgi:hypothetical protein